jgi:hypothetical protein
MKQIKTMNPKIKRLGKQLGLDTKHIRNILNNTQHTTEQMSFSQGPPMYSGSYYGTISINDFTTPKQQTKKE